ncbi:MAG TPA: cell division protein SepF [Pseudonocardia sp.]|nr:cell division protein SepF [Pseudonocardia sp.]
MGAMYRLKAYFGMVPAEELTEYVDEPVDRYAAARRTRDPEDRWPDRRRTDQRWDDRGWEDRRGDQAWDDDTWDDERWDARYADDEARPDEPRRDGRGEDWGTRRPVRTAVAERRRGPATVAPSPVRGALAIDPDTELAEPVRPVSVLPPVADPAAPDQRDRVATLARITTLQPRSYKEARTIGERYRDGVPVIMNLSELDVADAKRLVDFAAGLAFALRGSIDKVTNRVFLLTPANVEVSADDARKLAERGLFRQD